jgi:hypothetical protein
MTIRSSLALGCLASMALGACATPTTPIAPDDFTVSGRFGLPRAEQTRFAGQARVVRASAHASVADVLQASQEDLDAQLMAAFGKTMANHGYLAGADAAATTDVSADVLSISLNDEENGVTATALVSFVGAGPSGADACFTQEAVAQFTALTPQGASKGQRTFAIVAGALLAAAAGPGGSGDTSVWMAQQLNNADLNDEAINARREMSGGQGIAPGPGAAAARLAGARALQLAFADYVARLPDRPECQAAPEAAPADSAPMAVD